MEGEPPGNGSTNVRDFFRRPDTEDTLHFLKRQHMEQMQRMEELERDMVSPLKAYRSPGSPSGRKRTDLDSAVAASASTKPAGSPLRMQERASGDVLLQQLRGEAPLPRVANRRQYLYNQADTQASPLRYRNSSSAATSAGNSSRDRDRNANNSATSEMLPYIRALADETDMLRAMVHRQQQDINALNRALQEERARNERMEGKVMHLEDRVRFREIAAQKSEQQQPLRQQPLPPVTFADQSVPQHSYQQPMNIHRDDGAYMRHTPAAPPPMPTYMNSALGKSLPEHLNSAGTDDLLRGYNKSHSQEFISSPTNARPMPSVDEMTANLLRSSRGPL